MSDILFGVIVGSVTTASITALLFWLMPDATTRTITRTRRTITISQVRSPGETD